MQSQFGNTEQDFSFPTALASASVHPHRCSPGAHQQTLAGDGMEEIELRPAKVAVALIKFCHLKKIPLPRRAAKSIGVDRGQVSLVLQLAEH